MRDPCLINRGVAAVSYIPRRSGARAGREPAPRGNGNAGIPKLECSRD